MTDAGFATGTRKCVYDGDGGQQQWWWRPAAATAEAAAVLAINVPRCTVVGHPRV